MPESTSSDLHLNNTTSFPVENNTPTTTIWWSSKHGTRAYPKATWHQSETWALCKEEQLAWVMILVYKPSTSTRTAHQSMAWASPFSQMHTTMFSLAVCVSIWSALQAIASAATINALPIVDFGYSKYQATAYDAASKAYIFRNIRYAAPPLGERRFAKPQPPLKNSTLQTGSYGPICYQSLPLWLLTLTSTGSSGAAIDYGSEDCLFLDVVVPKAVFESKETKAPVLAWIFGGGYVEGSKDSFTPANGLIEKGKDHAIFVAMNYRLGAFGFSSGPSFQATGGIANLGFYDQRAALYWVQEHISKFGGDRHHVTIMGESAGGGSVMHQITAFGGVFGNGSSPFKQAIPQSPGWTPIAGHYTQEETYVNFLKAANCLSPNASAATGYGAVDEGLKCLRNASTTTLLKANLEVVAVASYGQFTYGPVVDGVFAPDLPGSLLAQGRFDHDISLLIGHNADEGAIFTSPSITNETTFDSYIANILPAANSAVIKYITNILYPAPSKYTPYTSNFLRAVLIISEAIFTCNTVYLAHAFGNRTHNYIFSIPPAFHGQDVDYTFYDPDSGLAPAAVGVKNVTVANLLQEYIMDFVVTGNVNARGIPYFPIYGDDSTVLDLNITSITDIKDPAANSRCTWWQKSLYL